MCDLHDYIVVLKLEHTYFMNVFSFTNQFLKAFPKHSCDR